MHSRFYTPVLRDVAEHFMFNFVPVARPQRKMAHRNLRPSSPGLLPLAKGTHVSLVEGIIVDSISAYTPVSINFFNVGSFIFQPHVSLKPMSFHISLAPIFLRPGFCILHNYSGIIPNPNSKQGFFHCYINNLFFP